MSTAKSLYINIYTIFKADAPERYLHDLASNVRELPHGSIERIKETIEYLNIDFDSQINEGGEERRQISGEQKKNIQNIKRMDDKLTDKDELIKEVLRFYSDLVEADLRMRPQEEVFRVCDKVLGINTDDLEQSIQLLLEACSLREKKRVQGTKTKTTPVKEESSKNNNNNIINSNSIEINPQPQHPKEPKKENKQEKQKNKNTTENKNKNNNNNNNNQKNKNKNNQKNNNNNQQNNTKQSTLTKENDNQPKSKNNNNEISQNTKTEQKNNSENKSNESQPKSVNFKSMTKNEISKFKNEQDIKFESLVKRRKELAIEMQKVEEEISNIINQRNDIIGVLLNSK